jgi:hypothetical protein
VHPNERAGSLSCSVQIKLSQLPGIQTRTVNHAGSCCFVCPIGPFLLTEKSRSWPLSTEPHQTGQSRGGGVELYRIPRVKVNAHLGWMWHHSECAMQSISSALVPYTARQGRDHSPPPPPTHTNTHTPQPPPPTHTCPRPPWLGP